MLTRQPATRRRHLAARCLAAVLLALPHCSCAGRYVWTGAVTDTAFDIVVEAAENDLLLYYPAGAQAQVRSVPVPAPKLGLAKIQVTGLLPRTRYAYGLASLGENSPLGTVTTFPKPGTDTRLTLAFGSCSKWTKNDVSWREIADRAPDFMLHMGDLFYGDITVNDVSLFRTSLETVVTNEGQQRVFGSMPVAYIYDDHDFGPNGADMTSPSRLASYESYSSFTPHYPLESSGQNGMYQAFTFGSMRFLITDTRSMANPDGTTTLGTAQRDWLFNELMGWRNYSAVIMVTSKPWNCPAVPGDDKWCGYSEERNQISNFIAREGISNLLALAGDSHMLAADNGQHTDYSTLADAERKGGAGFPILHSSPMANFGSSKTGPMSEGCFAYKVFPNYQYSTLEVTYPTQASSVGNSNGTGGYGTPVCYSYKGWVAGDSDPEIPQISAAGCITPENPSWVVRGFPDGGQGRCEIPLWPSWMTAVVAIASTAVLCAAGAAVYCAGVKKNWWAAVRYKSVSSKATRRRREENALREFGDAQEQP